MSQCSRDTSIPNSPIARPPSEPMISSRCGAIAPDARPTRSSLSASASTPDTSGTANTRAQSSTCTSGAGDVSRLATGASITWPCVAIATPRTGHNRSIVPAISSRRPNAATTGNAPNDFSTLGGPNRTEVRINGLERPPHPSPARRREFFSRAYAAPCPEHGPRLWAWKDRRQLDLRSSQPWPPLEPRGRPSFGSRLRTELRMSACSVRWPDGRLDSGAISTFSWTSNRAEP